jgi:hypothetical protein
MRCKQVRCRDCAKWGPENRYLNGRIEALCQIDKDYTAKDGWCTQFLPAPGEPRGTGLSKIWYCEETWLDDASIAHDLDVDLDRRSGKRSSRGRDRRWYSIAMQLAGDNWWRRTHARIGYAIIRAYGSLLG